MSKTRITEEEEEYISKKVMESPQNHYIRIGSDFSKSIPDYLDMFSGAYIAVKPLISVMEGINKRVLRRKKREERCEERDKEGMVVSDRGWEVKGNMKTKDYLSREEARKMMKRMDKNRKDKFYGYD